jgi:hypothetical protein
VAPATFTGASRVALGFPISVRRLVFGLIANRLLCPNDLSNSVMVIRIKPLFAARHSFTTGSHKLPSILLPIVERLSLFLTGKLSVVHHIARFLKFRCGIVDLCSVFDWVRSKEPREQASDDAHRNLQSLLLR